MTNSIVTGWNPERDLAALLDALTDELLIATESDVAASLRETGGVAEVLAEEARRLVGKADAGLAGPASSHVAGDFLRASIARNQ